MKKLFLIITFLLISICFLGTGFLDVEAIIKGEKIEKNTLENNLKYGARGEDVKTLQKMLKNDPEIYPEGLITGYFGFLTKQAVIRFQEKYVKDVLYPWGLSKGNGYVGSLTRQKLNSVYSSIILEQDTDKDADEDADTDTNEEDIKFRGYIIQFESKPILVKKDELEKQGIKDIDNEIKNYALTLKQENNTIKNKILNEINKKRTKSKQIIKPDNEFTKVFNGIAIENMTEQEADIVKKIKGVKTVHPNMEVQATLMDSVPLINADDVWQLDEDRNDCFSSGKPCLTGEGTTIAIIDTGVDYTHPDLGSCTEQEFLSGNCGKVVGGWDFVTCNEFNLSTGECLIPTIEDDNPIDDNGHGTHCAGIAAGTGQGLLTGVAPDAKLYAYKVLNTYGVGLADWIIAGIEASVDLDKNGIPCQNQEDYVDVLSLSLGGNGNPDDDMSQAVDNAALCVVPVIAAGNSGPGLGTIKSPGCAKKAITVGATDKSDNIAGFSSRGPVIWSGGTITKPDLVAPGVNICSAQSNQSWYNVKCLGPNNKYVSLSGTSMAAPHVAGAAALLKQKNPCWKSDEIKMVLKNTALNIGEYINTQGYGRVNVLNSIKKTGGTQCPGHREQILIAHYPFDTDFNDVNGNNGIPKGEAKIEGEALALDGINDYVELPVSDSLAIQNEITLSVLIKTTNNTLDNMGILKRGLWSGGWANQEYVLRISNGNAQLGFGNGLGAPPIGQANYVNGGFVADGQWHHITGVLRTDNTMEIWVDNILKESAAKTIVWESNSTAQLIGSLKNTGSTYFDGNIDEAKLWNYALSQQDIEQEYEQGRRLIAYYPFDTNFNDASGNGNNGICSGLNCPSLVKDRFNNPNSAYSFDGTNYFVVYNAQGIDSDEWSISTWVKVNGDSAKHQQILSFNNGYLPRVEACHKSSWGWRYPLLYLSGTNYVYGNNSIMEDNQWHNLIFTFKDSEVYKIYIDGIDKTMGRNPFAPVSISISSTWRIGWYLNGILDDLKVWNYVLGADEIEDLYVQQEDQEPAIDSILPTHNNWCNGADVNRDGKVAFDDHSMLANNYGRTDCSIDNSWCNGTDINRDGGVKFDDFSILSNNYNRTDCSGPISFKKIEKLEKIEDQLASISKAISNILEKIKNLIGR